MSELSDRARAALDNLKGAVPQKCDEHRNCRMSLGDKDYRRSCTVCGATPTVHPTELCGPCCFGEADTIDGGW